MRISPYCTASEYLMEPLLSYLNDQGFEPQYFDDVIHTKRKIRNSGEKNTKELDIFYFPFGCVTIYGAEESDEQTILDELHEFEIETLESAAKDIIYFTHVPTLNEPYIDEEKNEILSKDESVFVKLSIAHALAQSVKLNVLEVAVKNILDNTKTIRYEMARSGKVSLSKTEMAKQIGALFNERFSINLHSDILDTPEFFWRRPSYEPIYLMTAEFQDIQVRQNILNHRLDMIHELYNVLSNDLNSKHSTRLEIIIIVLIAIEVVLALSNHGIIEKSIAWFKGLLI